MKNFISKLFKKGKAESKAEDGKALEEVKKSGEPEKASETPDAASAKPVKTDAVAGGGKESKVRETAPPPQTPPIAKEKMPEPTALPEVKESLAGSAPVLKPLYGQKELPVAAPTPPAAFAAPDKAAPVELESENKAAPHQHLPFEGNLKEAIKTLVVDLADVYPQTLEQWEDGFRRDDNPEQEIAAWMHLAAVLKAVNDEYSLAQPEKMECFNVLIACFAGSSETIGSRAERKLLSQEQFDRAVASFYEGFVS